MTMAFEIGAHFPARYQADCKWCGKTFQPRETLTWVDNEVVCLKCTYDAIDFNMWEEFLDGTRGR